MSKERSECLNPDITSVFTTVSLMVVISRWALRPITKLGFQLVTGISFRGFQGCLCHRMGGKGCGIVGEAKGELAPEAVTVNRANLQKVLTGWFYINLGCFPP